jgi:hypothetical protein
MRCFVPKFIGLICLYNPLPAQHLLSLPRLSDILVSSACRSLNTLMEMKDFKSLNACKSQGYLIENLADTGVACSIPPVVPCFTAIDTMSITIHFRDR